MSNGLPLSRPENGMLPSPPLVAGSGLCSSAILSRMSCTTTMMNDCTNRLASNREPGQ